MLKRRDALKSLAVGVVAPGVLLAQKTDVSALYDKAMVIDTLAFDTWDEGGFAALDRTGYTAIQTSLGNRNFAVAQRDLAEWQKRFEEHPNRFLKVLRAADIERAKQENKLGVMLGFQNGTCIEGDIKNLDKLYEQGARCIQLTYNSRNLLGDGCTERTNAGLSDYGVSVVARMNELGIIVDLSHCGSQTSADGIEFTKRPPAFTHTMCQAIYDHPRAKGDALLKALAAKGGVVGVVALGYFVSPSPDATVDDYIRHIDHAVRVAGIDHVGLSTDYQIRGIEASSTRENWYEPRLRIYKPSYRVRWPSWIPELDKPERFRTVAQALDGRRYSTAHIEKILGLNWLRYFREVFGG